MFGKQMKYGDSSRGKYGTSGNAMSKWRKDSVAYPRNCDIMTCMIVSP
jgi:hypothetical protein